jgi:hypothetical protein
MRHVPTCQAHRRASDELRMVDAHPNEIELDTIFMPSILAGVTSLGP